MNKDEKEVLKMLVHKELKTLHDDNENIEFPDVNFLKSEKEYDEMLKNILIKLD